MGDHKSEGLSWADQWDPEPLPAPGEKKGAHKDAGKGTAAKKFLTFQWVKGRLVSRKPVTSRPLVPVSVKPDGNQSWPAGLETSLASRRPRLVSENSHRRPTGFGDQSPSAGDCVLEAEGSRRRSKIDGENASEQSGIENVSCGYRFLFCKFWQARNYELKTVHYNQLLSFHGSASEGTFTFIRDFYGIVQNFPLNDLIEDDLRMRCFSYTLKDAAKTWFMSLTPGSLRTWLEVYNKFIGKFYSHAKTVELRRKIANFSQAEGEPFHEAWERFKENVDFKGVFGPALPRLRLRVQVPPSAPGFVV
nr:Retrotransposon gag protein [Ipomoea batatas]